MRAVFILALGGIMLISSSLASAQTSTELRGIVKDPSGAVIPNVNLTLKDMATGIEKTTVSGAGGAYLFTALVAGTYQITATANGFQTAVIDGIVLNTGRVTDMPVSMKIGAVSTTVEVTAAGVLLETTSNTVSATIKNASIETLPYSSRDSLYFALLMPGAQSAGSDRYSTFNGLPNASLNLTVDGVNNNSQRWKSGGTSFFQFAPTRIDAMEEVTVSTSGMGAESAGQGAMSVQMVTKRGTDQYRFRILEQFHNEALNAWPYMTKLRSKYDPTAIKPVTRQNYALGSVGGPALPFIPYFKNKLYFFAYFEANPQPFTSRDSTNMLQHEALTGTYRFKDKSGVEKTLNVFDVAAANGLPTATDPTVKKMLDRIVATESTPGVSFSAPDASYPFQRTMYWNFSGNPYAYYPTARLDYQINPNVAWHGSWNYRKNLFRGDDQPYPGADAAKYAWANQSTADVWVISNAVDWTISPKMVNNFTFGNQMNWEFWSPGNPGYSAHQWAEYGDRIIQLPFLSDFIPNAPTDDRNNPVWEVKDNLSWVKGKHTLKFGGTYLKTTFWGNWWGNDGGVPYYDFGVTNQDPAYTPLYNAMLAANASTNTSDINNFMNLYAMLTGRLSGISAGVELNPQTLKYEMWKPERSDYSFTTVGAYFQDSFRMTPRLTMNYGLRWQFDGSIHGNIPIYSLPTQDSFWGPSKGNFQPGVLGGNMNPYFAQNSYPYKSDLINPAPNLGFAWNPNFKNSILKKIFGGDKTVIRTSFGMTFYNEGLNAVTNYLSGAGASQTITATPDVNFTPGSLFLKDPPPTMSAEPAEFKFPVYLSQFVLNGGMSISAFDPNLRSPYTTNWTFGIQREIARGMVLDVRYVGNKSTHMWHRQNLSEVNIIENGFLQEFKNAQSNLAINRAAGVTSFENRGLAGQVALPVLEAAFGANGSYAALSQNQSFRNSSYIQNLDRGEAGALAQRFAATNTPTLYCRMVGANFAPCAALGYTSARTIPINFFKPNPFANNLNYQDDNGDNNYNGLQVELRKQLSRGLMANVAYTWSHMMGTQGNTSSDGAATTWSTLRNPRLSYGDTGFDHRHNITTYWTYDLPMGPGRWFSPSNRILSRIVSNWQIGGIYKFISGAPQYLTGYYTFNSLGTNSSGVTNSGVTGPVVFGNGLTVDSLVDRLNTIVGDYDYSCQCFHTNVSDIQQSNGAVNPAFLKPGTTPGAIGYRVMYRAKWSYQVDMSITKEIPITERVRLGFKADASNFLNHPWQTGYGSNTLTGTGFGRLSSFASPRTVRLRAYIDF